MSKVLFFVMALALVLGLTQCKKEQHQTQGVRITLNVRGGASTSSATGNSKVVVNPVGGITFATVDFENGDVVYVGNNGVYCGYLQHNGTNFTGTIDDTNLSEDDYLHFYFMGNKGTTSEPTSVCITNQTSKYPVISYARSTELYSSEETSYSAKLQNYCAIVKFTTIDIDAANAITITGQNNTVEVHFDANNAATSTTGNPYTFSKSGNGDITLHAESNTERWAILLPNSSAVVDASAFATGYAPTSLFTVPVIEANGYYTNNGAGYSLTLSPVSSISNGLPNVEVDVQGGLPVDSKLWKDCFIRIGQDYYYSIVSGGKIRGRGNATWDSYPKKPYRIKFSTKKSPFGFPSNKDWVLLAQYNDKSLMREAYMSEVSKAAGCEYTINYQHVNLYLNGEYLGVYLLTDQVKVGNNRVQIEDDGFFIEEDLYYYNEPLWFTTGLDNNFSFKYPDPNDGEIMSGDASYNYITSFFESLEAALMNVSEAPEIVASYIDYHSFAKWFLVQEIIGNWEPNRFYVLPNRNTKLKMYPAWDAEWSLGLADNGNPNNTWGWYYPPAQPRVNAEIMPHKYYFPYLLQDPAFVVVVKEEWQSLKSNMPSIIAAVDNVASTLVEAQNDNFEKWPILNEYTGVGLIALGSWQAEVDYVKNFFIERSVYLDNYINNLYECYTN